MLSAIRSMQSSTEISPQVDPGQWDIMNMMNIESNKPPLPPHNQMTITHTDNMEGIIIPHTFKYFI